MFEQLFQHPHARARHCGGPLAEERRRHLSHCAAQRMAVRTLRGIAIYTLVVARVLRLDERPGEVITGGEIEAAAKRWARRRSAPPGRRARESALRLFQRHARRWLQFLGRLQSPATAPRPPRDLTPSRSLSSTTTNSANAGCRPIPSSVTAGRCTSSWRNSSKPADGSGH